MKNLAPDITRQRLLIEGYYAINVDKEAIKSYFKKVTESLNLRVYGEPIIFSPQGEGKGINQGYDAFVPLIDSGIYLGAWTNAKFLSIVIYTCKNFDENKAVGVTKNFFRIGEIEYQSF